MSIVISILSWYNPELKVYQITCPVDPDWHFLTIYYFNLSNDTSIQMITNVIKNTIVLFVAMMINF